jgi:hypothetical protein
LAGHRDADGRDCQKIQLTKEDIPMHRRLITIAILAAVVAAIAATPAVAAERSCGWTNVVKQPYHVQIIHGSVSCHEACWLIKTYGEGGGTPHGGQKSQSEMYSTLPGGWICVSGAGGAHVCSLGKRADPRDVVSGIEKLEWERSH